MPFNGFSFALPEFNVTTPQCGYQYTVQSLTTGQVIRLRTSLTNHMQGLKLINEMIWDSIKQKPESINEYIDFKKQTTLLDRQALLFGIYIATFGDVQTYAPKCNECDHVNNMKINLTNIFTTNMYADSKTIKKTYQAQKIAGNIKPGNADHEIEKAIAEDTVGNITQELLHVILPISGIHTYIKQPCIINEEEVYKDILGVSGLEEMLNDILCIDRFEQIKKGDKVASLIIKDPIDILKGYESLTIKDKQKINSVYDNKFGDYKISLKTEYPCNSCGVKNELYIDILSEFFRSVAQA